jgi:DNA mismatch endonuclease (patch repair protein)
MAAVKGTDTKPELFVRRVLHRSGFRFRLHRKDLPGTPDIVLPRFRIAVFVHGCYWHGHECQANRVPRTNAAYWSEKIRRNVERDARNQAELSELGWTICVVWECQLDQMTEELVKRLHHFRALEEHGASNESLR